MKFVKKFLPLLVLLSALEILVIGSENVHAQDPVDPNNPNVEIVPVPNDDVEIIEDTSEATVASTTESTESEPPAPHKETPKKERKPKTRLIINEAFFDHPIALNDEEKKDEGGNGDRYEYREYWMEVVSRLCGKVLVGREIG